MRPHFGRYKNAFRQRRGCARFLRLRHPRRRGCDRAAWAQPRSWHSSDPPILTGLPGHSPDPPILTHSPDPGTAPIVTRAAHQLRFIPAPIARLQLLKIQKRPPRARRDQQEPQRSTESHKGAPRATSAPAAHPALLPAPIALLHFPKSQKGAARATKDTESHKGHREAQRTPRATKDTERHKGHREAQRTPRAASARAPHPSGFSGVKMSAEEILVRPVELGENFCLYFDDDDELECDALCKERILQRVLRNINSQLLVVRPDLNVAAFEDVTDQEMQSGKGMHFSIHCYKTTTPLAGLPVAFSVQVENKSYYMCCEREGAEIIVRFKEGEVPKEIPGESNIIFFKKTFTSCSSDAFKFEYSLERGMFLAFEEEGRLRKLILKKLPKDEVDETMKMSLYKFSQNENHSL